MPETPAELDKRVADLQDQLTELRENEDWSTVGAYRPIAQATASYLDVALKEMVYAYAQTYADIAATGVFSRWNESHTELPAELEEDFNDIVASVSTAQSLGEVRDKLNDAMWDVITAGGAQWFLHWEIGKTATPTTAIFHLRTNDALLRQGAQAVWEVIKVGREAVPVIAAVIARATTQGDDAPPPEGAERLVFYVRDPDTGMEDPPFWLVVHLALVQAHVTESLAQKLSVEWRKSWGDAAGLPALKKAGQTIGGFLEGVGGVGGLLLLGLGVGALIVVGPRIADAFSG